MKRLPLFLLVFFLASLPSASGGASSVYVVEPVLVNQPAYAGMNFYVYRPYNLPEGWYLTFDGYPVARTSSGVWVYGAMSGNGLVQTAFIVGSVNPATLPLAQYPVPAAVASVSQVQVLPLAGTPNQVRPQQPIAPSLSSSGGMLLPMYIPSWSTNSSFNAVGSWNRLVDRMGILDTPRVPIAWKGDRPKAIYAWTGRSWYQMVSSSTDIPEKASEILKGHLYSLTRMVHGNNMRWLDSDTPLLAHQAAVWGYLWMGRISPLAEN
ncbi:MAG: hypothetical protein KBF46_01330 [Aminivibrio sp.]|nr:hypothetical protein [Aminivibrio sp.]